MPATMPPGEAAAPLPACPITGVPAEARVQTISARLLYDLWRFSYRAIPSPLPCDGARTGLYRSPCGLKFF
jgi:hypothetical protein